MEFPYMAATCEKCGGKLPFQIGSKLDLWLKSRLCAGCQGKMMADAAINAIKAKATLTRSDT